MDSTLLNLNCLLKDRTQKEKDNAILIYSRLGFSTNVEKLIESGADVNARNADKETPLILATQHKNSDVINMLIKAGADKNLKDYTGYTAAMHAYYEPDKTIYNLLADKTDNTEKAHIPKAKFTPRYITRSVTRAKNEAMLKAEKSLSIKLK